MFVNPNHGQKISWKVYLNVPLNSFYCFLLHEHGSLLDRDQSSSCSYTVLHNHFYFHIVFYNLFTFPRQRKMGAILIVIVHNLSQQPPGDKEINILFQSHPREISPIHYVSWLSSSFGNCLQNIETNLKLRPPPHINHPI